MFEDTPDQFDDMAKGATAASAAFTRLQADAQGLLSALQSTGDGAEQLDAVTQALESLQTIISTVTSMTGEFSSATADANSSVSELNSSGSSLVSVLGQIAAAVGASGMSTLAANASQTAQAFSEQKASMDSNSSSLSGLVMNTVLYISLAAAVYDTLRVVDGALGGQNLKWDHLGGAIAGVGETVSAAGGGLRGIGAVLTGVIGKLTATAGAATAGAAGMTTFAAASQLAGNGMRSLISLTGSVVTGLVKMVNSALASQAAMTTATTAGTALGKSFKAIMLSGLGFGHALSGMLGLLKSLPRLIMLSAGAVQAFIVAAAPVLLPLLAIAAALIAIIAAWKAFKALLNIGWTLFKSLASATWEVAKAAYALGKALAGVLYEGLKIVAKAIKAVVSCLIDLYRNARDALIGALDRLAAAFYAIVPALNSMSNALGNAADKVGKFFARMQRDAQTLSNTLLKQALVFGDSADAAMKWSVDYSRSVGRAFTDTARQVIEFTREFTKLDVSTNQARKLSQALTQLGNDIASKLNVSPVGVMEALKSAISGNTDALYEYGIAVDKAAVEQKLLAAGLSPTEASAGQKALATLSAAADKASFAYNHLRDNSENYENQQRTLHAEVKQTSELLGGILQRSYSRLSEAMIGGLRVIQRWISANEEFVRKFVDLPELLNGASIVCKALAITAGLLAGAILAVSSAVSILLSPLGWITRAMVEQSGVLGELRTSYENAFGGAIKNMVEAALAARIAGVTIQNWFTIGFLAVKAVAADAFASILTKMKEFLGALPEIIRSFAGFEIFGTSIGRAIETGLVLARQAFWGFGAVAGTVMNAVLSGFLDVYEVIRKCVVWAERLGKAIAAAAAFQMGMYGAAYQLGSEALDSSATDKAKAEIATLRKYLDKPFDPKGMQNNADRAGEELEMLKGFSGSVDSPLVNAVANAAKAANDAISGTLGRAAEGMSASAQKLKDEAAALRDVNDPSNLAGGMELDKEAEKMMERIREAAKNNPLLDGFKNLFSEVIPELKNELQPKASAQGTFGGQLQSDTVSVAKQALSYQRQTAENTKRLLDGGAMVAGG